MKIHLIYLQLVYKQFFFLYEVHQIHKEKDSAKWINQLFHQLAELFQKVQPILISNESLHFHPAGHATIPLWESTSEAVDDICTYTGIPILLNHDCCCCPLCIERDQPILDSTLLNNRIHKARDINEFFSLARFRSNSFPHDFSLFNATIP